MTGLHAQHQNVNGLAALVANRTIPSVGVRVILLGEEGKSVARIELQAEPLFVGGELDVGFFRIPLPHLDRRSFREAFANAIIHRDYTTTVVVQLNLADADVPFVRLIQDEEWRTGREISLDSLIVLAKLRREKRFDARDRAASTP